MSKSKASSYWRWYHTVIYKTNTCQGVSCTRFGRIRLDERQESVTFSRGISWSPGDTPLLPAADTPNTGKAQVTEGLSLGMGEKRRVFPFFGGGAGNQRPKLCCHPSRTCSCDPASPRHATPDAAIAVQKHKKHNAKCNPCVYLAGSYGCTSPACPFCHHTLAVPNQRRGRPRKRVRDTYKNMLDAILQRPNVGAPNRWTVGWVDTFFHRRTDRPPRSTVGIRRSTVRPEDAARHMALQSLAAEDPYVRLLITGRLDAEPLGR